jgi:hypothetical protein
MNFTVIDLNFIIVEVPYGVSISSGNTRFYAGLNGVGCG